MRMKRIKCIKRIKRMTQIRRFGRIKRMPQTKRVKRMNGVLFGVSVGPGDPGLMTLKAASVLRKSDVVAIPETNAGKSITLDIVKEYIYGKKTIMLNMPMTDNKQVLDIAHNAAAEKISAFLNKGQTVALVTLGDASLYSTFSYIQDKIEERGYETRIIPGVPSFCAVAAELKKPLSQGNIPLRVIPGGNDGMIPRVEDALDSGDNVVIMKVGKRLAAIKDALTRRGRSCDAAMVEKCGMDGQVVYDTVANADDTADYLSTVLVKNKRNDGNIASPTNSGDCGKSKNHVYFVGAGSGATDLITLRGVRCLSDADMIIYAGSLVNRELLEYAPDGCVFLDSSGMTLDEVIDSMKGGLAVGGKVVRLHTGDPSIYGAIREQFDELDKAGITYEVIPGVSSFLAAAAALKSELTPPGVSQTVILTRMAGRTSVPDMNDVRSLASHKASMAIFLSGSLLEELAAELNEGGYELSTPVALVYRVSWKNEKIIRTNIGNMAEEAEKNGLKRTLLVMVGEFLDNVGVETEKSRLYAPDFSHGYRKAKTDGETASKQSISPTANNIDTAARSDGRVNGKERTAIISFTKMGSELADKLTQVFENCTVYKFNENGYDNADCGAINVSDSVSEWTGRRFRDSSRIIFIGALGIAVRSVAPHIRHKTVDPAVICVDEAGRFSIPVLGGHLGGGNDDARKAAEVTGGQSVITTATDLRGVFAVDVWAKRMNLYIENPEMIKKISAALLNGDSVGIFMDDESARGCAGIKDRDASSVKQDGEYGIWKYVLNDEKDEERIDGDIVNVKDRFLSSVTPDAEGGIRETALPNGLVRTDVNGRQVFTEASANCAERLNVGVCVSCKLVNPFAQTLLLRPKNVVLGIGCRRGTRCAEIKQAVEDFMLLSGYSRKSLKALSSVDIKQNEEGIVAFCDEEGIDFYTHSADELNAIENEQFSYSRFVKTTTDVDCVCERAAAARGKLKVRKTVFGGVTLALAISN